MNHNKTFKTLLPIVIGIILIPSCAKRKMQDENIKRFFSAESFWNTPIPENPEIDPKSDYYIHLIQEKAPSKGQFAHINVSEWTLPVYEVTSNTPAYDIKQRQYTEEELIAEGWEKFIRNGGPVFSHGKDFGKDVPIPINAKPDPMRDGHMALVDWDRRLAWDMWDAHMLEDGTWESSTGMVYRLDGEGVFRTEDFDVKTGESIHLYGPSRASGVPAIAGLIMYDEVKRGHIRHKLSACTPVNAFRKFTYPACWTDGYLEGGIPEGAVIQLDPDLDLNQFDLYPGEKIIAKALQEYGVVIVDNGGAFAIYAEGLYYDDSRSWNGLIAEDQGLKKIPCEYFRVLKIQNLVEKGH